MKNDESIRCMSDALAHVRDADDFLMDEEPTEEIVPLTRLIMSDRRSDGPDGWRSMLDNDEHEGVDIQDIDELKGSIR